MLTYDISQANGPVYQYIYERMKADIMRGNLASDEKLPSKRGFAAHLGLSTITVQNAYDQLASEGYIYTQPKKGYFVARLQDLPGKVTKGRIKVDIRMPVKDKEYEIDLSNNRMNPDNFPFSVWSRISRLVLHEYKDQLMEVAPTGGVSLLREAIADHLRSFRGMLVDPNQIIVGAGTEYLYGLLVQLLGDKHTYCIENPGYEKLVRLYGQYGIHCRYASMDEKGITVEELKKAKADICHISPNHHFPTGFTMPASRRYEILGWANEKVGRYIIEDDYDSEFRTNGRPIPTMFGIDGCEKVIYMNTFSKSLTPTIRISYMVLPTHLANRFYEKLSFYACTVSNFEQYTLASFMKEGYFEKHINRMRLYYSRQRKAMIQIIKESELAKRCRILDHGSGLHFLLELDTGLDDVRLCHRLQKRGLRMKALSDYYMDGKTGRDHVFILNYSNISKDQLEKACKILVECME